MQTNFYQAIKNYNDKNTMINDCIVIEAPLQININQKPYTVVMRTPGDDFELVRGLLYAEDIYKNSEHLDIEIHRLEANHFTTINVNLSTEKIGKGYLNKRSLLSVSSCGICGKQKITDLKINDNKLENNDILSKKEIDNLFFEMQKKQITFQKSGGSHAAAIFNKNKKLLTIKEDIGRHNAVDKCVGNLLITKQLSQATYLFVSGRVSYEIITKAFFAKIATVIAVSACSSLAIDFAKEFGICLIGFNREEKMTIYTSPKKYN